MNDHEVKDYHLKRTPIVMSGHTVALITLFHLPHDDLADIWVNDYLDYIKEVDFAADQMVAQLTDGGHCSPAFLIATRRAITKYLKATDDDRKASGIETHFATAE